MLREQLAGLVRQGQLDNPDQLDQLDLLEQQVLMDPLVSRDKRELLEEREPQDLPEHPARKASWEARGHKGQRAKLVTREPLDLQVKWVALVLLERLGLLDQVVNLVRLDQQELPDPLDRVVIRD